MVIKHRTGWGYETLVREVSDSLHLRRFCLIALGERVPDESTVRKLTRRLGGRGRERDDAACDREGQAGEAVSGRGRCGSIRRWCEADVRYPTDSGLALDGPGCWRGEARRLLAKVGRDAGWVADRSRAIGRRVRAMSRTLGRRTGERKAAGAGVDRAGGQAGGALDQRGQAAGGDRSPAGAWPWREGEAAADPQAGEIIERAERVGEQIQQADARRADHRPAGLDLRPGRPADPQGQARQAKRVRVRGAGLRGDGEHQDRRARADHPRASQLGNPNEDTMLPDTVAELDRLGISPREIALDGGFNVGPTAPGTGTVRAESGRSSPAANSPAADEHNDASRDTEPAAEGRISHLKRGYGLRRSRAEGPRREQAWTGWAILTYNLDTLAIRTS